MHVRPLTRNVARGVGAALLAAALVPWLATGPANAVLAGDTGNSGDSRAASFDGNATRCNAQDTAGEGTKNAGVPGVTIQADSSQAGTNVTVTGVEAGYTDIYVVVKGGNGFNVY